MSIPMSEWRWRGMAGHLIMSSSCCFHMVTDIGEFRVSTVGCYHKEGEPKDYDHRTEIGSGRLYETMVFRLSGDDVDDWGELDSADYNDEAEAETGHMEMCRSVAERSTRSLRMEFS